MPGWRRWPEWVAECICWGGFAKNEHQRETGFLSGEAAVDAYLDTTAIKYVAGRDRPFTANGQGNFFDGGGSFPSLHSSVSWAIASVIAHEYPGPVTQVLSYGLAGAVSVARVEAHQHFMSDAVIGSALGWYLGGRFTAPGPAMRISIFTSGDGLSGTPRASKPA